MKQSLIRPKYTAKRAAISTSHMYDLISKGKFPKPVKISERISAFVESEVDTWINEKISSARSEEV